MPLEDLAKRVTKAGTDSRPLLGGKCAKSELSRLMQERWPHYAKAHCRLSFEGIVYLFPYQCLSTCQLYNCSPLVLSYIIPRWCEMKFVGSLFYSLQLASNYVGDSSDFDSWLQLWQNLWS